jgi:hypothetical protein
MAKLKKLNYHGPRDPGIQRKCNLTKNAPSGDFPIDEGILVRAGEKVGYVCWWGTIALHIEDAMRADPRFLADIEAACQRAKAEASPAK